MAEIPKHRPIKPDDRAFDAVAEEGVVLVDSPSGVAITLTAKAASRSARAIARAASTADAQGKPAPATRRQHIS